MHCYVGMASEIFIYGSSELCRILTTVNKFIQV